MCDCLMLQRDCLLPGCFWQQHKKRSWVKAKRAGKGLQRWCLSTCPVAVADHLADHDSHAHLPENQALCSKVKKQRLQHITDMSCMLLSWLLQANALHKSIYERNVFMKCICAHK